jgi:hypothetical protein
VGRPQPPPELAPLVARLRRGELLALAALVLVPVGGVAWSRGMAGWVVGTMLGLSAVLSALAAWVIVPTVGRIRRLGRSRRDGDAR